MATYYLEEGDCREIMASLPESSVDSIVTDPPYGLSFMGKGWDRGVPGEEFWREALRVAKPGAHLLAFGGTRTSHRLTCAIEDAGWEIRDCVMWVYGSGFPKSLDVSKALAKKEEDGPAEEWQGWGTALKPAWEPIIVARKPLDGTVAANVLAHGTGALNIDGCRVCFASEEERARHAAEWDRQWNTSIIHGWDDAIGNHPGPKLERGDGPKEQKGRWPANLIHDGSDDVMALFPQTGKSSGGSAGGFGDDGSAARFFYCAKARKSDRGPDNTHPTVKPVELMRYLCRLVTPPGGLVLDPFTGSGSTGVAALREGFDFLGCELNPEYIEIARRRLSQEGEEG